MHDTSHPVLCCLVLRSTWTIQVPSATADEYETSVLLLIRLHLAVLADKVVRSEFRSVESPVDVDIDDFQVWFLWSRGVVGEDVILLGDPRVGNNVMNAAGGRERLGCCEEGDLIFP